MISANPTSRDRGNCHHPNSGCRRLPASLPCWAAFAVAAGLLSGVAQGAAATGGKNSAQLNALSAALQDTASPSVTGRSPSANVASGAESSSPVNGCAHLVPVLKPAYNDADMFIENSCSYPIVVVVCNVAATSQSCTHQYSGVKPNGRYGLEGGFLPKRVCASFSCKAPFYPTFDSTAERCRVDAPVSQPTSQPTEPFPFGPAS